MIKVLVFAASPRGTDPLDLDREFREIEKEVRRATFREAVELILVPGGRPIVVYSSPPAGTTWAGSSGSR